MADFETTTNPDDCRVWSWFITEIGDDSEHVDWGQDIESFFLYLAEQDRIVYFHNLKFDGTFILDYLLNAGYVHKDKARSPYEMESLIDKKSKFYSIKIILPNFVRIEFRDSMKKLNFSVAEIAKAFKLEMSKGEIDYHKYRPVGYKPTPEEIDYGKKDVLIVAKALEQQFNAGMSKLTAGADSLFEYKKVLGHGNSVKGEKIFRSIYPVLPDSIDSEIRKAYRGGFTYSDPRYSQRLLDRGKVYDVNSLYPAVMYKEKMPTGEPKYFSGEYTPTGIYPLWIQEMVFTAKLKPNHIPTVQLKKSSYYIETEYVSVIDEPTTMSFTNVDLEILYKHYDVTVIDYIGGYMFKESRGMFKTFIEKWMDVKENSEGAMRQIAKLHLNSLYGKFATNPDVQGKIPYLDNSIVKFKLGEEETRAPIYTAMGAFITAYARYKTITAAQDNYATFAYCDTDSLHLITTSEPNMEIHPSRIGAWKHEGDFIQAFYIRAKAYVELMVTDGSEPCEPHYDVHIAGLPREAAREVTFETLTDGRIIEGKKQPKTVPGGVVLVEISWKLNF